MKWTNSWRRKLDYPPLPVYEVLLLQVLHGRGDLCGHVQQHHSIYLLFVTIPQVVQQVAVWHVLCHDVERRLQRAYTCGRSSSQNTVTNKH